MNDIEKTEKRGENSTMGEDLKVYELGYHILPIIADENLPEEVSKIKAVIEKSGGLFIGEEGLPKSIKLAYDMSTDIDNKKTIFGTANFGWVKFEANPLSVKNIIEEVEGFKNILRFILLKSVRESKMISKKMGTSLIRPAKSPKADSSKDKGQISEVEVDQAIEELILE